MGTVGRRRPGAATNIATEAVVNALPDGHTLLLAGVPNAINATLYHKLSFNFIRDIAPVAVLRPEDRVGGGSDGATVVDGERLDYLGECLFFDHC